MATCLICERPISDGQSSTQRLGTAFHALCWANRPAPTTSSDYEWNLYVHAAHLPSKTRSAIVRLLRLVAHGRIFTETLPGVPGNISAYVLDEGIARIIAARVGLLARITVEAGKVAA